MLPGSAAAGVENEEEEGRWVKWLAGAAISGLGFVMLTVPLFDMWDDVNRLSWNFFTTAVENALLVLLSAALVAAGIWLARRPWRREYVADIAKVNLVGTATVALLFAWVISLQLWSMGTLKPYVLALDGVLFGAVATFGAGVYHAHHRMAFDELRASEAEHRSLTNDVLDTSEVATVILDDDFTVVWLNQAMADYFGLDRDSVVGRDMRAVLADDVREVVEDGGEFLDRVAATYDDNTDTENFECRVRGAGVEDRWLEHWSQPIQSGLYEGGRIEHYYDVTAQKEYERELEARERSLREMYDIISDEGRSFERKVDDIVGIGRDLFGAEHGAFARIDEDDEYRLEVVQSDAADLEAGDVLPFSQTHCERMVRENESVQFEGRSFDAPPEREGTDVGFETYVGTPVHVSGQTYGALCFLDREEADAFDGWQLALVELMGNWVGYELERQQRLEEREEELREQERRFESVVETVSEYAIFSVDTEGHVTTWNQGAEQIKGYERSEILGEHIERLYPEDAREEGRPHELLAEAAEEGYATDEGWRLRKDGTRFWADVTITARYDEDGDLVGYTKITRDMTDRREYERTIEHERERLEFINRVIRHNLLNGLNVVRGRAQHLLDADDPAFDEHLPVIRDRVVDMSDLVQTMRGFMDVVVNDADHDLHPVDLRSVLESEVELTRESYDATVAADLPDAGVRVEADDLLGEVFENVLTNAVQHNDADDPRIEVWTTDDTIDPSDLDPPGAAEPGPMGAPDRNGETPRPAVTVHVADNGPGIPDDERTAILQKGVSELSEPGHGFGLYLVNEMMTAYGGVVDVSANDPSGTVFELTLPRAD